MAKVVFVADRHKCYGHYKCKEIELREPELTFVLCLWCHYDQITYCNGVTQNGIRCKKSTDIFVENYYCSTHLPAGFYDFQNSVQDKIYKEIADSYFQMLDVIENYESYVYAIYAESTLPITYVKIGYSKNPEARLKTLQNVGNGTTMPLGVIHKSMKLIGTLKGGQQLEKYLHGKLHNSRKEGEWFEYTDEVKNVIDTFNTFGQPLDNLVKAVETRKSQNNGR